MYTKAQIYPVAIYEFAGQLVCECKCRVYHDSSWVQTVRLRIPLDLSGEEIVEGLMVTLDVGNIDFQHHLEFDFPPPLAKWYKPYQRTT